MDGASIYGFPYSQRRHYERLNRFSEGFLAFGDAICGFHPIYGQGMTAAALEAPSLERCLRDGTDGLANRFFSSITPVFDSAWELTTGEDLRFAPASTLIPRCCQFQSGFRIFAGPWNRASRPSREAPPSTARQKLPPGDRSDR